MKFMKQSIARQITAVFVGVMILTLATNLLLNNLFMEKFYLRKMQHTLVEAYRLIDSHITEDGVDVPYFATEFREVRSTNNITVTVLNQDFEVLPVSEYTNSVMAARLFGYSMGLEPDDAEVLKRGTTYTIQKKDDEAMDMNYLEMWGNLSCGDYFIMRIPLESIHTSVGISTEFVMYISIVPVLLSCIVIWLFSRRIARPIVELTDLSRRMANLDFDAKYTSGGEDEIGQLGEHFNQMSETLEQTISQLKSANNELQKDIAHKEEIDEMRKEFLSNVSHELKTPLALIQGYAEGLQECVNDDPESREFYCEVIMDEAGKMNEMVRKLLTLNELEFGNEQIQLERFDIVPLIRGKMQSVQILVQQKDARIEYIGSDSLHVWGDEFKVEEVLTNYLSNALNHVEGEKRIEIRSAVEQGKAQISVFNTGQPIPEEDIDQIWVKFYKVDKARTREYGGSGVGLSIVKAIMDSLHQPFGVRNLPDGVEFWFDLECADTEEAIENRDS